MGSTTLDIEELDVDPARRGDEPEAGTRTRDAEPADVEKVEIDTAAVAEVTEAADPPVTRPARWAARRVAGGLVRMLAMAIPVTASAATGILLATVFPAPSGPVGTVAWYGTIFVASMLVLVLVDRVARRLLPLSVLLRISLVFPDQAPSRLSVALRAGSKRALAARIEGIRAEGGDPLGPEEVVMLGAALNAHDRRTRGHSERVRALTELVAQELRLPADDADRLRWGAFLHDIGKLSVPARVLNKSGKLDAREWHVIQRHPLEGERVAESLEAWLGDWLHAIGQHHERFDGTGYPDGLGGDEISLAGRIVAVTDAYETMTAVRSYNRPKSPAEGRKELQACAGSHFDPIVVRAFMNISIARLRWTAGLAAWLAQLPFIGVPMRAGAQVATSAAGAQGSAGAVAGSVLMSVAGIATPIAIGSGVAAAALVAPHPVVESQDGATDPGVAPGSDAPSDADSSSSVVPGADGALRGTAERVRDGETGAPEWSHAGGNDKAPEHSNAGGQGKSNAGGNDGALPGQSGSNPGNGGAPPGQSGSNPGNGGAPPGQSGSNPGNGGAPPGQSESNPGAGNGNGNGNGAGNGNGNGAGNGGTP